MEQAQKSKTRDKLLFEAYAAVPVDSGDFSACEKIIDTAPADEREGLHGYFCKLLILDLMQGFFWASDQLKAQVLAAPDYKVFRKHTALCDSTEKELYLAVDDFLNSRFVQAERRLKKWIVEPDVPLNLSDVEDCLLSLFKQGREGMWRRLGNAASGVETEKGVVTLLYAIECFYWERERDQCLDTITKALWECGEPVFIKEMLALYTNAMGMWRNSLSYWEQVVGESGQFRLTDDAAAYNWMTDCCVRLREWRRAEEFCRKVTELAPDYPEARNRLGWILYRQRKYTRAREVLEACVNDRAALPYSANNLLRVYLAQGDRESGRRLAGRRGIKLDARLLERLNGELTPKSELFEEDEETAAPREKRWFDYTGNRVRFSSEETLQKELAVQLERGVQVFGFPLSIYQDSGGYGVEYRFPGGRMDILAQDRKGDLWVIELKKDSGYDDAYQQIRFYINWLEKHRSNGGKRKVNGIICLNSPAPDLVEKVRSDSQVRLFEYAVAYRELT